MLSPHRVGGGGGGGTSGDLPLINLAETPSEKGEAGAGIIRRPSPGH